MAEIKDLTGQRFGKLVCIKVHPHRCNSGRVKWECRCDCGNEPVVFACNLARGNSKSCGCETKAKTHGKSSTRLYKVWSSMKHRCGNSDNPYFHNYGGKGVSVCQEWMDYEVFYQWAIKSGYKKGLTIERADNSKNYCPDNCSWIPKGDQSNNTSRCKVIEFNGMSMNMKQWSDYLGIPYHIIQSRVRYGWSSIDAITQPKVTGNRRHARLITVSGKTMNISEWARHLGLNQGAFYYRASKVGGDDSVKSFIKSEIQQLTGIPVIVCGE